MARRPPDLPSVVAALWAVRALRQVRRQLGRGLDARVPAPPPLPRRAVRGVQALLWRRSATCLEQALILQRWEAAHGSPRAVVIGVQAPASGFRAHAWLDGSQDPLAGEYHELKRLPANFT